MYTPGTFLIRFSLRSLRSLYHCKNIYNKLGDHALSPIHLANKCLKLAYDFKYYLKGALFELA